MDRAAIFTIGYGGRAIGEFLELLAAFRIELLIDIRSHPTSRFQLDYRKNLLKSHIEGAGLGYLYLGDRLGGKPRDESLYVDGRVDYAKLGKLPAYQEGIAKLLGLRDEGRRIALMCAEKKPEACHRSRLVGETLAAMGIPVLHIDGMETARQHTEVVDSASKGQLDLL